jgi:hypothetical protein
MAIEMCTCCGAWADLDCTDGDYFKGNYYCENCYVEECLCMDCGEPVENAGDPYCCRCCVKLK